MGSIPLVIDILDETRPNGIRDIWNELPNPSAFIADIVTPQFSDHADMGIYERAVPDPFARVFLFSKAFDSYNSQHKTPFRSNVYARLASEWRGLIAAIVLDTANINVREISLEYSDGKQPEKTSNLYEMKGALGNMLHLNREKWSVRRGEEVSDKKPFLNLISYYGKGVGATCPDTLLFTSASYNLGNLSLPWTGKGIDGKIRFRDPLQGELSKQQTLSLYAYTGHLLDSLGHFEEAFPSDVLPKIMGTQRELEIWREEIKAFAAQKEFDLSEATVPPVALPFAGPYASIFNYSVFMTGSEGDFMDRRSQLEGEGFDPLSLLLTQDAKIARLMLPESFCHNPEKVNLIPSVAMPAQINGRQQEYAFFSLPLSEKGVEKFGKKLEDLVALNISGEEKKSRLSAIFFPDSPTDNLLVKLSIISSDGKRRDYERRYTVGKIPVSLKRDILIWPNFISYQWQRYYLYSDLSGFDSMSGYDVVPFLLADHKEGAEIKTLVDTNREGSSYRYMIFEAAVPFGGVRFFDKDGKDGGVITLRYVSQEKARPGLIFDRRGYNRLDPVTLGLDFGSTNTSISYARHAHMPEGFSFVRQRVSLLSRDADQVNDDGIEADSPRSVLFFSGNPHPVESNAISSILTLHPSAMQTALSQEVTGGFPSFSDSLPVEGVMDNRIILNYGKEGVVEQIFNMKWETGAKEMAHISAFLKTLLLQTYARLFELGCVPAVLCWSYPSSMSTALLNRYRIIFSELASLTPVAHDTNAFNSGVQPYPLKVSRFVPFVSHFNSDFISRDSNGNGRKLFLPDDPNRVVAYRPRSVFGAEKPGEISLSEANAVANHMSGIYGREAGSLYLCLDIGGSTTDISALFLLRQGMTMVRQNSVRFAAELVSKSTSFIPGFGQFLKNISEKFRISQAYPDHTSPKQSSSMAPYLFNRLLEKINTSQLGELYTVIAADCPQLMWVDMFVAGLLVYYAGQTAAKIVEEIRRLTPEEIGITKEVNQINLLFAGKGARIMQWVEGVHPSVGIQYYNSVFKAGFLAAQDADIPSFTIFIPGLDAQEVKYEVAKGLVRDDTDLCNPSDNNPGEIVSEDGFAFKNERDGIVELSPANTLTPEMMEHIGDGFEVGGWFSANLFKDFFNIFGRFSSHLFNMNMPPSVYRDGIGRLKPAHFIKALPEYQAALEESRKKSDPFDFVAPIILLEGKEFLEATFFPWIATLEETEIISPVIEDNSHEEILAGKEPAKGALQTKEESEIKKRPLIEIEEQPERKEEEQKKEERGPTESKPENDTEPEKKNDREDYENEEEEKEEEKGEEELEKLIPVKIEVSTKVEKKGLFGKKKVTGLNIKLTSPGNPRLKWASVVYVQEKPLLSADRQNIMGLFQAGETFPLMLSISLPLPQCPEARRLRIYFKPHPDEPVGINNAYETETCVVDI